MPENVEHKLQVGVGFKVEDTNGGISNLAAYTDKLNETMSNLATTMSKVENGFKQTGTSAKQTEKTYTSLQTIMNEYKAGIIDDVEAMKRLTAEQERLNKELSKVDKGTKKYDSLVAQLAKAKAEYKKLYDAETKAINEMLEADEKAAKEQQRIDDEKYKAAVAMNKAETKAFDEEQQKRMKSAKESADFFRQQFAQQEQAARQELAKTTSAYKMAMNDRKASSKMLGSMLAPVNTNFSNNLFTNAMKWTGAYALVHEFTNIGRKIGEIEYNTINNQRLMGNFSKELRDSLNASAADIARNTGILITDAQEIQGAWVRINEQYAKSPELLGEMAEVTSKFMNVGEIENAEEAVKLLNSTLLQFNLTGENVIKNAEDIANKFAYMADVTAMGTADEYAEGIAKMGANVKNMNGDVDDAIVLLSLVGDKLAKNGTEAGNALNTFTAYMHRSKTLNLFDKLAVQLNDANVRIRDGEKGLKNYEETLKAIASAYSQLREQGDQEGMNSIIETLGATRQRATAQAVLEAISSDDGQNLEYYYSLLEQATAEGSYLEEQNEVLMTSMKNQYNSLSVTIQEAGMTIANAGVIDILTGLMNGFEFLLSAITKVPTPILTAVSAIMSLKVALSGLNKFGEVTGYTNKFAQSLKFGTSEQIKAADATRQSADAFLAQQKSIFGAESAQYRLGAAYQSQLSVLTSYEQGVANANMQLAQTGDVKAYITEMDRLKAAYLKNVQATEGLKLSEDELAATEVRNQAIKKSSILLEQTENTQKKVGLATLMAENGYKKAGMAIDILSNPITAIKNALQKESNAETLAGVAIDKAAAVGKTLLSGATTALGVALNFLLSPMVLVTAGISLLTMLFSQGKSEIEDYKERIDELSSTVDEAQSRIDELKKKQRQSGLSGTEETELKYLQDKIKYEKELLKIEQQKLDNTKYSGTGTLWWREEGKTDEINDTIRGFKNAQKEAEKFQETLEKTGTYGFHNGLIATIDDVTEANRQMEEGALNLLSYYEYLEANINLGTWTGDALDQANEDFEKLTELLPDLQQFNNEFEKVNTTASLIDSENIKDFNDGISERLVEFNKVEEDIQKLIDGASSNELMGFIEDYPEFASVIGKTTAEQIAYLRSYQAENGSILLDELDTKIEELNEAKTQLETEIASIDKDKDSKTYAEKNEQLQETINLLNEVQAKKDIAIKVTTEVDGFNLGDVMNQMDGLVSSTKSLVEAQNQLAQGTALSKQALWELAMQYPEMLYQANLFADGSVEGQQAAINSILDMKNQEFNNSIDLKISELEAEREFIQGVLDLEQQKLDILTDGTVEQANGELRVKGQLQELLAQYNNAIGEQHTLAQQQQLQKTQEGAEGQAQAVDQANVNMVTYSAEGSEKIATNIIGGFAAGVDGANRNASKVGGIFETIKNWASNLATWVAKGLAGDESGGGSVSGSGGATGDTTNTFTKATYDGHGINGQSVSDWIRTQQTALKTNINAYKVQLQGLNNAIANLQEFKNQGLTGVSNNYSPNGAGGKGSDGSGSGGSGGGGSGTDDATKAIEKFTEEFTKNIESMQDRIAKALKKQYQEQYDIQKKALEEAHNKRVAAIQAEIDELNGNRPEDKQARLSNLEEQLALWQQDNSTLGKAKQKELSEQIKELNKEIKLDELNAKMDAENEAYQNSIDSESEFYDATLADLDKMMSDEHVYKEANKLIANNRQGEIVDLLTEYDPDWSGISTLMGETAGEIIAEEVALAIANYKDVKNGTITEDGGKYTNKVLNGGSGAGLDGDNNDPNKPDTNKPIKTGGKVKIKDTNAKMYYTAGSGSSVGTWKSYSGKYYVVNTSGNRAALSKTNNINGAIGWIDKKYLVGLASGGYTGNSEGLAMLHKKERVLDARQTSAFENLVYDFLPQISSHLLTPNSNTYNNGNNVTFNRELVKVDIGTVVNNKQFDVDNGIDNLDRAFRKSLRKSGIALKK